MSGQCNCTACGQNFKSIRGFDKHRTGGYGEPIYKITKSGKQSKEIAGYTKVTRRCMTEQEMLAKGMSKNEKGLWITKAYDHNIVHTEDETEETGEEVAD